jgi:formylglycine-generating enzyme
MKNGLACLAAVGMMCLGLVARADIVIDTVTVGDVGNAADTRYANPGYGSVNYAYKIGTYEVTAGQYADFLNHKAKSDPFGLYGQGGFQGSNILREGESGSYSYSVASDWSNRPVSCVDWVSAARFVNWLHNGQGDGDTETGAYTFNDGVMWGEVTRNPGAKWFLPTEDEWYKAAYYKGGGTNAGYWDYPTQSDSIPSSSLGSPTDPGNNATFLNSNNEFLIGAPYYRTEVGSHENSESAYGTFDQGGNVWEWNEAIIKPDQFTWHRGLRGGSFASPYGNLSASWRNHFYPDTNYVNIGFRVAGAVPEPSPLVALAGSLFSLLGLRRYRR